MPVPAAGMNGQDGPDLSGVGAAAEKPSRWLIGGIGSALLIGFVLLLYLLVALWPSKVVPGQDTSLACATSSPSPNPQAAASSAPKSTGQRAAATKTVSRKAANPAPSALPVPSPQPTVLGQVGQIAGVWSEKACLFGSRPISMPVETRFIWLVAIAAALGGFVSVANSFAIFLGNGTFKRRWTWWYALRVPIGVALAVLFYFALRAGFFTAVSGQDVNPFGVVALGGLVGMFSKKAR